MGIRTGDLVLGVVLEGLEVLGQSGQADAQQVAEHGHVDGQAPEVVREVGLGQDALDQVDHHLDSGGLVPVDHLQYQRRQDVEALAVADRLVPASEAQQHPAQHRLVVPACRPAEQAASRSVQVLRPAFPSLSSRAHTPRFHLFNNYSDPDSQANKSLTIFNESFVYGWFQAQTTFRYGYRYCHPFRA